MTYIHVLIAHREINNERTNKERHEVGASRLERPLHLVYQSWEDEK